MRSFYILCGQADHGACSIMAISPTACEQEEILRKPINAMHLFMVLNHL